MKRTTRLDLKKSTFIPIFSNPFLEARSWEKRLLRFRISLLIIWLALSQYRSLNKTINIIRILRKKFNQANGFPPFSKVTKIDGKYYWRMTNAGYPSPALKVMILNEMNRVIPIKPHNGLSVLLLAITKKCPLNCEHCYEWFNLNQKEALNTQDLIQLVRKYQAYGTSIITFGGGEPLLRIKDIYQVLAHADDSTDFWMYTSGFGLTEEQAKRLKVCGLTGIIVSLDHFIASEHDRFRGFPGSFNQAIEACIHARNAGLVLAITNCARPDFINNKNLKGYLELGRRLGASFIQFLEARSSGRYQQKRVTLSDSQISLLEKFYLTYNQSGEYWDYPIIDWPDYRRRRVGCLAGGNRFFYIDTDGDAHLCPFCSDKVCSTLNTEPGEVITHLKHHSCDISQFSQF